MIIPTQVTPVQIHGGEVENDLKNQESVVTDTVRAKGHTPLMFRWIRITETPYEHKQSARLVIKLTCHFPCAHTFSPGVTDILQMQCM